MIIINQLQTKIIKGLVTAGAVIVIVSFIGKNYFTINMSPSMERGIYLLVGKPQALKYGDIVNLEIPNNVREMIYNREYLTRKTKTLLKKVAALPGDKIEIKNNKLLINEVVIGTISKQDGQNRELPCFLKEGIITEKKVFLLGIVENSFDGRYFGLVDENKIKSKAILLYKF